MRKRWREQSETKIKQSGKVDDVLQILAAVKDETDRIRMIRLENRLNVQWLNLNQEEQELVLKEIGEVDLLNSIKKVNGRLQKWQLTR